MALTGSCVVAILAVAVLAASSAAWRAEAGGGRGLFAPVDGISITQVSSIGTGCPAETPLVTISADRQSVVIPFANYSVVVPAHISQRLKTCTVMISLSYPVGWAYAPASWTYQGWVELAPGLVAYQSAEYFYQGGASACQKTSAFDGGQTGLPATPYEITHTCDGEVAHSPCGEVRGLNILTRLWIDNRLNPEGHGSIRSGYAMGGVTSYNLFACNLSWTYCY